MTDSNIRVYFFFLLSSLGIWGLMWMASCASGADQTQSDANQTQWIRIGQTTKDEVVARYGEPDLMQTSPDGAVATYRPTASKRPPPSVEIPTAQPGPFGAPATTMKPIQPGLGAEDMAGGRHEWIRKEIKIRYDAKGIVREVLE